MGETLNNPTSLDFGPNGALYVTQQNGTIWEMFIERDEAPSGNGTYTVVNQNVINVIKNLTPNHNDDGTIFNTAQRQITGILTSGTAENPILYVTSSDYRIGGGPSRGDFNLDTNSGVLSRLTWNGQQWEKVDLVRGLPRSEENHSTNGLDMFTRNGETFLLIQSGGNTNMGAPSNNFAGATETFLSAALLIVNLTQLEEIEAANGGPFADPRTGGTPYVYDLPTLNDPERPDITNADAAFPYGSGHPMYNATIDVGDPWGGNNGLNQAFAEPGGPVQVFSPGYRNAYDVVISENGKIYTSDNGPNSTWGGPPPIYDSAGNLKGDNSNTDYNPGAGDYVTNEFNVTNGVTHGDQLHYIGTINDANGTYYAGHPTPVRAFPVKAGIIKYKDVDGSWVNQGTYSLSELLTGVSGYFNTTFTLANFPDDPREGDYITDELNNPNLNIFDIVGSSTNGICEYTATNFNGALKGNLLTASYSGNINRYVLDASGTSLVAKNNAFLSGFGSIPLDVIAQGDNDPFPGTIWAVTYGADNLTIFEPADFITCILPDDPDYDPLADYDGDQFTNQDEVDSGTDPCSAGSQPNDNDNDKISDLNDPDDDNDGIPDLQDPFAIDPDNGLATAIPLSYDLFNNDPGTGFFGLGFTGLMLDPAGATNYLDQYDEENLSFGGAAGKASIDFVDAGDARAGSNSQLNAFQLGVNVDTNTPPLTVQSVVETPFNGTQPTGGQSYGIYIGTGVQNNYLKFALSEGVSTGDGVAGLDLVLEVNDVVTLDEKIDVPGIIDANGVTLYISIDPAQETATAFYSLDSGITIVPFGVTVALPSSFLDPADNQGLAVGIISTAGTGTAYTATWDNLIINQDQPGTLKADPLLVDFGDVLVSGSSAEKTVELSNLGGATDPGIVVSALNFSGADASLFSSSLSLPLEISPGETVLIPVNLAPDVQPRVLDASLEIVHDGVNSPIAISLAGELVENLVTTVVQINAGGGQEFYEGKDFSADQFFTGGKLYTNTQAQVPAVFQTERTANPPQFSYNIPVTDGNYTVILYFAEIYWGATGGGTGGVGSRIFDVTLEGDLVLDNFDIFAEAGAETILTKSFIVTISDGSIDLFFDASSAAGGIDQPKLSAIEILGSGNQIPKAIIGSSVTSGFSPLTVNFTGSDSQDDDGIATYAWDFGDGTQSAEPNPTHTFNEAGNYTVSLTVTDTRGASDTATLQIQATAPDSNQGFELRVNAGGTTTSYNGKSFLTDDYFNGGQSYSNTSISLGPLFQTERTSPTGVFEYQIPVINGNYQVVLYFAEIFWGATGGGAGGVGNRIFDVSLEGDLVLDNYDIFAEVGAETVVTKSFTKEVTDGVLNIYFSSLTADGGVDQPKISGIEIIGIDGTGITPLALQNIPDQNSAEGESVEISVSASGGDPQQNYTYALSGAPEGIQIEPTNGLISGVIASGAATGGPASDGVYNVTVTVSQSGIDPAEEIFTWNISAQSEQWSLEGESENYLARSECSFVQAGDKFYLFGGRQSPQVINVYDYSSDTWTTLATQAPLDFNHVQAVAYQGLVWVIGGFKTNNFPSEVSLEYVWIFNPVSGDWYQGPPIPANRQRGSGGVVVYNNKFYLLGGNTQGHSGGYVPFLDEFDPATGTWTALADAPRARDHFHAVVVNGKLYAIGGRLSGGDGGTFAPTVPEVDVYDFASQTWSTLPSDKNIPTPRAGLSAVNLNGEIHVMGGEVDALTTAYDVTEVFDPVAETWRTGPAMNFARHGTQAIASGNALYITAGSPNKGGGSQKNMEYLYSNTPQGNPSNDSELQAASEVVFEVGGSQIIDLNAVNGNIGVWVNSVAIQGPQAAEFQLQSVPDSNRLINANSTWGITVQHVGSSEDISVPLVVTYNNTTSLTVNLIVGVPSALVAVAQSDVTSGEAPLTVNFTGSSSQAGTDPIVSYNWDFGDGNTATVADPVHTYQAPGEYVAVLTVTDEQGLQATDEINITILDPIQEGDAVVSFTLVNADTDTDITEITDGQVIDATLVQGIGVNIRANTSPPVVGSVVLDLSGTVNAFRKESVAPYALFGDSGGNYRAATLTEGNYTLTATPYSSGGGGGTPGVPLTVNFSIEQAPVAQGPVAAATSDVTSGDVPLNVAFSGSASVAGDTPIVTYAWDFGDGNSSSLADPVHTYQVAGTYTATLTVTDEQGLQDTDQVTVIVTDPSVVGPTAFATSDVASGEVPLAIVFSGSGSIAGDTPIVSYAWDFGDGNTSVLANPTHTYQTAGTFTATLTVTDEQGLQDTDQVTISATDPVAQGDAVVSFTLINADDNSDLFELTNGIQVDLSAIGNVGLNIRANTNPTQVGSVILALSGPVSNSRKESVAPYALFGDSGGNYKSGILTAGNYTITATPYSGSGGSGTAGQSLTVGFSVVDTQVKLAPESPGVAGGAIVMYPNPADSRVYLTGIVAPKTEDRTQIYLHDLKGALIKHFNGADIYEDSRYTIPVDDIQQGIYILSVENSSKVLFNNRLVIRK
ncbi:PKD domain-containing protein [Robertkochia sediminum]|uniref:PKD domain-containing protein n=1 Tax=Robertkochia sediminum TaxID=2785326 RepID=UPI0019343070|nr:PKD domain-containing protein [Robertkochia sediminum]MBL7473173.1 PKD domain-containing protein [Robertkochia sediminum]